MDDYLAKPFNETQLAALQSRWLTAKTAARTEQAKPKQAPAPENAEVSVIDEHALNRIRAVQPELVEKVINIYSKDAPQLMTAISDAIAQSDPEALKKAAHTLKSSSANVGAVTLAELCKTLEMMGREKAIEKADEVAGKLSGEYSRVLAALNKHLGETNSAMLQ
jgi:HPt (histidine-containing phosphotransfer) domain-containing protein